MVVGDNVTDSAAESGEAATLETEGDDGKDAATMTGDVAVRQVFCDAVAAVDLPATILCGMRGFCSVYNLKWSILIFGKMAPLSSIRSAFLPSMFLIVYGPRKFVSYFLPFLC